MSENEQIPQEAIAAAEQAPKSAEAAVESGGISEAAIEMLAEKLAGRAPSDKPAEAAKPEGEAKPEREARPPREGRGERRQGQGGGQGGGRDRRPEGKREGGQAGGGNREGKPREGQREGNRDGKREDRGGRGPFRPELAEIEYDKLVADSLYLDNQAHAVVARLRDLDSGTKSQLRRFYNAVRRACRTVETERQHEFVMLRARLAYTIARHSLRSLDPMERLLLQVTRKNDARGYERFRDLFEAIIAYNE